MRVGIVGCGYAGGSAALLLARAGHDVTVFEAVAEPAPLGAGILIQPTGMEVLHQLGLLEAVLSRASRVDRLLMRTLGGSQLMQLSYDRLEPGLFGAGLHRGALFEALFDTVRTEIDDLVLGTTIERVDDSDSRADWSSGSRPSLVDAEEQTHGPFDVVVIADGARSQVRTALGIGTVSTYAYGTAWYVGPDPEHRYQDELYQVVQGTRKLLGFLPTGLGPTPPEPNSREVPLASLYWGLHEDDEPAWRRRGLSKFRDEVLRYEPHAEAFLDSIDDLDQVLFARYHRVVMRPWHYGRIVFIGDAAHAMSPQLGQGTNLALIDAAVLARCLTEHDDAPTALAAYSRQRRAQVGFYEWAAHLLMPMFQSRFAGIGPLRNALFWLMSHLPIARGQMIATMAGVKRGVLRPSAPLDLPALSATGLANHD